MSLDRPSGPVRAGTAFVTTRRQVVSTSFVYDDSYLGLPDGLAISPELSLSGGPATTTGLPGALRDSAPDRWGRNLIRKRLSAERNPGSGVTPSIGEVDYLLGVSDITRQGALRFSVGDGGPFLAVGHEVPKLIALPKLLNAADAVARSASTDELAAVEALLDAGSGSLGGARPKASVIDEDRLYIAKFPHHHDEWDVMAWEKTALDLAERCGITTPSRRLIDVDSHRVLLLERFDRADTHRVAYVSAMTLVGGTDGGEYDYIEVAEALSEFGGNVAADLRQLWRRIAFSIAVNNTDDHLRNHGFLHRKGSWTLSPVFDVNPNPSRSAARVTSINFTNDRGDALSALLDAAPHFGLDANSARSILDSVAAGVADWSEVARSNGISESERHRFAPIFED